jgi:hypothetical protein
MIRNSDTGLIEGLEVRSIRAAEKLSEEELNAITACCFQGYNFLIIPYYIFSIIYMSYSFSSWKEALGILEKSASSMGKIIVLSKIWHLQTESRYLYWKCPD